MNELYRQSRLAEMDAAFEKGARAGGKGVYLLMLRKANAEANCERAVSLIEELERRGEQPSEEMFQLIVNTLADAGRVAEASLFLGLPESHRMHTMASCYPGTRALSGCCARVLSRPGPGETPAEQRERSDRMLREMLQREMPIAGMVWGEVVVNRSMARTEGVSVLHEIQQTLAQAEKCGFSPDPAFLSRSMDAMLANQVAHEVVWWFYEEHEHMLQPDHMSAGATSHMLEKVMLVALSYSKGEGAFRRLVGMGHKPDVLNYRSLLMCLCRDTEFQHRPEEAHKLIAEMLGARMEPTAEMRAAVAAIVCGDKGTPWREALEQQFGGEWSQEQLAVVMVVLQRMGKRETVLQLWKDAVESGTVASPGDKMYTAAVKACIYKELRGTAMLDPRYADIAERLRNSGGSVKLTEDLLVATLRAEGLAGHQERTMQTFRAIMKGQLGEHKLTRKVLLTMVLTLGQTSSGAAMVPSLLDMAANEYGVQPTIAIYNAWLASHRLQTTRPTPKSVRQLYQVILDKGLVPDKFTYNTLFTLLERIPFHCDINGLMHFFLHEWWAVSQHAGKDEFTNTLLLKLLGSRVTVRSNEMFMSIYRFMKAAEDPSQWPTGHTYDAVVKVLVRTGRMNQAVGIVLGAYRDIAIKRSRFQEPEDVWRHTVEYLMANLLGQQNYRLADKLRKIAAEHGFDMGCPLPQMEDDE